MLLNCTDNVVYVAFITFYLVMSIIGFLRKKAWFNLTSVIVNITLLVLHALACDQFSNSAFEFNMNFDMICLAINIPILIIVDEVETRRSIIREVFKNRYKNN